MGDVFAGRYELVDPLGSGGSGVVWRAWDQAADCYVAAKVLRQVDAASLVRFVREQAVRIDHDHVLAPTGWAGSDDRVLLSMPLVRGGSVAALIGDHGALPIAWVVPMVIQMLDALAAIHAEGVVHRDVKPANLLLDATGRGAPHLWLADFGIASALGAPRLTHGPYASGTPGYVAPECLREGWVPSPAADQYSAGVCAVEMLTGQAPVVGASGSELTAAAAAALLESDDFVDASGRWLVRDVIADLLASDAARRPDAAAAADALRTVRVLESPGGADPVEVFEHLPPYPQGWGPCGPLPDSPNGSDSLDGRAGVPPAPVSPPPSALLSPPTLPTLAQGATGDAETTEVAEPAGAPEPTGSPSSSEDERPPGVAGDGESARRGIALPLVAVATGAALLVLAVVLGLG
ncbi:serine/threonine-protein kinase [Serinibacter salmoneus]|uniref:serine/threonine-protein kinase n=1 Tax=Serinibacter salmoneus TaxID=556530 RepID=UPI00147582D7|nr:serine/threonine-protein kinase [Serinibacter salmoneus]